MWMNVTHSRYDADKYEISTHFFCHGNVEVDAPTGGETPSQVDITPSFTWTPGSITYADGVASSQYASDWLYSNMVDVARYDSITFTHIQTTNTATPLGYAFYDKDGKYITGASNGGGTYETAEKTVTVPEGAVYFRVMWMNTTHSRYDTDKYEISTHFFCYGNVARKER